MRMISLELQNICQHKHLRWEFQDGLIGVFGPNGSGKSNAINAGCYAALTNDWTRVYGGQGGAIRQQSREEDVAKWPQRNNLEIQTREDNTFLVAVGSDPQIETRLDQPASGNLVVALDARPAKGADVEFFWAAPGDGYRPDHSNKRQLNAADQMQQYLFRIGGGEPVQQLRFDPLGGPGELQIGTLTLYRLPE